MDVPNISDTKSYPVDRQVIASNHRERPLAWTQKVRSCSCRLSTSPPDAKLFLSVKSIELLVVHDHAFAFQQHADLPIAEPTPLVAIAFISSRICQDIWLIVSYERQLIVFAIHLALGQRFACAIALGRRQGREERRTKQRKSVLLRHDPSRSRVAARRYGARFCNYLRVPMTEHPFSRLARLYDRIAQTDAIWQLRHMAGIR